jgi:hypothetical protein
MDHGRDALGRLICQVLVLWYDQPGGKPSKPCHAKISAITGLQELQKLDTHLRRKHRLKYTMEALLELRARWEQPPIAGDADAAADAALRKRGV